MSSEKCLVQLDNVLNHLDSECIKKIPYKIRKTIQEKRDTQYKWNYDETKSLDEQNLDRRTIAMLSYLNMEYLLDKEQKKLMEDIHRFNEAKSEEEKSRKYDKDNIFKPKKEQTIPEDRVVALTEVPNERWYKRLINFLKNIFKKA